MWWIILIIIVVLILIYLGLTYNSFVVLRNRVKDQWAQIDVQLKRRFDLIPNLVETVKGYASHEKDTLEGVKNYSIAVKEKGEDIIFLRKIVNGGTDESYGVRVAKLAGVPKVVTQRANEILKKIERKNVLVNKNSEKENKKQVDGQLDMYNFKLAEIAHELDKVNINELTPIDALNTLVKIKEELK